MNTIAVADIGTNSTRLLIAQVDGGRVRELVRRAEVTRLGEGLERSGRLGEEPMERVHAVLAAYREQIDAAGAERAVAVLTSAVRDAANGAEFTAAVRERHALEARVIDGEEEAQLTYLGATSERDPADPTPLVVIDIGGGSTELVIGAGGAVEFHVSTQAGVVRQGERHLHGDPPPADELEALAADARAVLAAAVPAAVRARPRAVIATAGTATSLAAVDLELEPYDPSLVHGHVLSLARVRALRDRLAALPLAERQRVPGLPARRAATIVAGSVILLEALALFDAAEVEISEHDILRGAALRAAS